MTGGLVPSPVTRIGCRRKSAPHENHPLTDPSNQGGKPDKQLFLAYRRAGADRPGGSADGIEVGRLKLGNGYALEALIPWKEMGFEAVPAGEFGLSFKWTSQAVGRVLQMTYGSGTNEAWIKSDRYLKARLKQAR